MSGNGGYIDEATRRQRRAADPGVAAWVSAHAGSGKTHVLVARVIRLMLEGAAPDRILCLTYTRAAAAEMKNRLFERLGAWIALDDNELRRRISEELGHAFRLAPGEDLGHARRLFARALETPGGLKIQTLHAFCERLLKAFPVEAGLPPGFEVMDELTARELLRRAMAGVLGGEGGDPSLAEEIDVLSAFMREEGFEDLLARLVGVRERLAPLREDRTLLDAVTEILAARLGVDTEKGAEALLAEWCEGLSMELLEALHGIIEEKGKNSDLKHLPHLRNALQALEKGEPERVCKALKNVFFTKAEKPRQRLLTKDAYEANPLVTAAWEQQAMAFMELQERLKGHDLLRANRAFLRVGLAVLDAYEELKRRQGLYDYEDLVIRTRRLLGEENVSSAWVLYRLDGGIDHVLIDEAQDTSPAQWEIVARLTEDFCAGESARNDGRVRTVFAVGDFKQSIYSFQGAEPAAFRRMREHFAQCYENARLDFVREDMNVSFRTAPVILRAVDKVLERIDMGLGDERLQPHLPAWPDVPGLVEMWPVLRPERDAEAQDDPWQPPRRLRPPERPQLRLARRIAAEIHRLVQTGTPVHDRSAKGRFRPMTWGDVLVLVQRRSGFMDAIVAALKQTGIPVAGADRLRVTDHLAVKDLMALGRFLMDREDDLSLACVLKSPLLQRDDSRPFDDGDLMRLAFMKGAWKSSLWSRLQAAARAGEPFGEAVERLRGWWRRAGFEPPFDFYAGVLERDRGRRDFIERLGTEVEEPLDAFLDLARQYEREHPASLAGFLDFLETANPEIRREMEGGKNEVRVMTVHGAKGLEAPVVILADTCRKPEAAREPVVRVALSGDSEDGDEATASEIPFWTGNERLRNAAAEELRAAWLGRRRQEYWRLLYVAMTRARDRLYVCGALGGRSAEGNSRKDDRADPLEGTWYAAIRDALFPGGEEDPHVVRDRKGRILCWRLQEGEPPPAASMGISGGGARLPDWVDRPAPPARGPSVWLAPSRLARVLAADAGENGSLSDGAALARAVAEARVMAPVSPLSGDPERVEARRFERGVLIHRLLQHLPELPAERRREAAVAWLVAPPRGLPSQVAEEVAEEVIRIIDDVRFSRLFGPDSRAEVPFAARIPVADGGHVLVSGQIDRLVVTEDEILVADYKTARPAPERIEDVPEEYVRQLAVYARALKTLWPGRRVRAVLIWTAGPSLMEIPAERLAAAAEPLPR
jgi:ATP-dependent helicase/nuclease subunit A